jgi:hypothetical protein
MPDLAYMYVLHKSFFVALASLANCSGKAWEESTNSERMTKLTIWI